MNTDMSVLLREEESVFQRFNTYKRVSDKCTAFASPASQQIPHWNLVYPPDLKHRYTIEELGTAEAFYSASKLHGHVLVAGAAWAARSAETVEYFVTKAGLAAGGNAAEIEEFTSPDGADLAEFCSIVQTSFGLSDQTTAYFRDKMAVLAEAVASRFLIIEYQGRRCGTASTFRTHLGSDFLFNFGVLPEFRNKNLGRAMLQHVVRRSGNTVYTYSDNPIMRDTLLPSAGFRSLETTHAVPLDVYRTQILGRNGEDA